MVLPAVTKVGTGLEGTVEVMTAGVWVIETGVALGVDKVAAVVAFVLLLLPVILMSCDCNSS